MNAPKLNPLKRD